MLREDIDREMERLKAKRAEINSKMGSTRDFDAKEKLKDILSNIDTQIRVLESMRKKSV